MKKLCFECGEPLSGRTDKKFCSDACRNSFHNRNKREEKQLVKNINNTLRKNRRILIELKSSGHTKVSRNLLVEKGFNFYYFTNMYQTPDGSIYYFCYEQGFLPLANDWCTLVCRAAEPEG